MEAILMMSHHPELFQSSAVLGNALNLSRFSEFFMICLTGARGGCRVAGRLLPDHCRVQLLIPARQRAGAAAEWRPSP
jgi:hypothetical protein